MKDYKFTGVIAIKNTGNGYLVFPLQNNLFCSGLCYNPKTIKETQRLALKIRKMILDKLQVANQDTILKFETELKETEKRLDHIDKLVLFA